MKTLFPSLASLILLLLVASGCSSVADTVARGLERGAERATERETSRQADRAVTAAARGVENAVTCLVTDEACVEAAMRDGRDVVVQNEDGEVVEEIPAPAPEGSVPIAYPDGDVNANYDFVPGQRELFHEDYSGDRLGNFPRNLEFVSGNWEIAEWQGRRLLRNTGPRNSALRIPLPESLPEKFTIETEVFFPHSNQQMVLLTQPPDGHWNGVDYNYIKIAGVHGTGVDANSGKGLATSLNRDTRVHEQLMPIRIIVDGGYVKTFVGENRTANIPNAVLPRSGTLYLVNTYFASEEQPMYIGPIRVAASGISLYDRLVSEGRVTTRGILFDTGSAGIRSESAPTLQEIAEMLRGHADLRLRVEGHTDDTGAAAANLELSRRRAESVRAWLVERGIEAGRLEIAGLGESQPVEDNDTPEGRQQNRRVVLVRL
jgi:outer membrane protein OmpA-like peptidoglycan-associated protein